MRPVDVTAVLERQKVGLFQVTLAALLVACMFVDGFDAQATGYAAPAIIKAWHVPRSAFGAIFGAGNLGLMLGAIVMGHLGDKRGRKTAIVVSAVVLGIFSLLTIKATTLHSLMYLRFFSGLGVGGVLPNVIALGVEYSPKFYQARSVWVMFLGYTSGASSGALIATHLFSHFGWPVMFLIGGIAPIIVAVLVVLFLPESVRLLALKRDGVNKVVTILTKIDKNFVFDGDADLVVEDDNLNDASIVRLFTDGRALATVLLWLAFAANLMTLLFLLNWLPTVLESPTIPSDLAAIATAVLQAGGIGGGLVISRLLDTIGPRAIAVAYGLGVPLVALIGLPGISPLLLVLLTFGVGCCIIGGQTNINAVASKIYPTFIRSNGVGWANAAGRVGSVLGPVIGGMLIGLGVPTPKLFLFAALPLLCAALLCFGLSGSYLDSSKRREYDPTVVD